VAQQLVSAALNPLCYVGVSGTTIGRIVLETAVRRRVVRRRDDDAVGEILFTIPVINENCSRDNRRRSEAVISLDDSFNTICREHFQSGALGWPGHGVRILAHKEGAVVSLAAPVITNGLSDGQNMGFGERSLKRRAPMSARSEADELIPVF